MNTQDAWERAKERAEQSEGSIFLRLQDGDKVIGAFVGQPFVFETIWNGERSVLADSPEGHDLQGEGHKPRMRVKINFWEQSSGEMKVWELSSATFKTLLKLREKYGLDDWLFEVERVGVDLKTVYNILPEAKLTEEQKVDIAALDLIDLENPGGDPSFP